MFTARLGVRTRILAIALVPSLTLLTLGTVTAGDLLRDSYRIRDWVEDLDRVRPVATELLAAVQDERLLSLRRLTGDAEVPELPTARARVDRGFDALERADALRHRPATGMAQQRATFAGAVTSMRAAVDGRRIAPADAYAFYNAPYSLFNDGFRRAQQAAPDPMLATAVSEAVRLLSATEAMSRSNAVALALIGSEGRAFAADEFSTQAGFYRAEIRNLATEFGTPRNGPLLELMTGAAWRQLSEVESAVHERLHGDPDAALPVSIEAWQDTAREVTGRLLAAYSDQHRYAAGSAADAARRAETSGLRTAIVVTASSVLALLIAVFLADRIIRRLRRLRAATLVVADQRLPAAIRHAETGSAAEPVAPAPEFDAGRDEIGEVARAFEYAATVAVTAAAAEARTRAGVRAVFVTIARRSQQVIHRQLDILDTAERASDDPALLDVLFELDHLATRERRNAENLLILGGSRPGRRWRHPVPVVDIVRSAVGETADYLRVRVGPMPEVAVRGAVVADMIHLVAELLDNATAFSPPPTRVDAAASLVTGGLALDIRDQGTGLTDSDLRHYNSLLAAPPDFGPGSLAADSRMGLFVVAHLANAHGVTVRLAESEYGGVRATVLLPAALLDDLPARTPPADRPGTVARA
ncbi:ATP-binding protein [Nocardia sp. NPDC050435]|uniref:sensor histidine kinase n=1 Tax=Nocardia sp. NPDC050435 TaxID=3155040 RepID=UPI0033DE48FB